MTIINIKQIAGDCQKNHRWCLAILAVDTPAIRLRIVRIGRSYVWGLAASGKVYKLLPNQVLSVW